MLTTIISIGSAVLLVAGYVWYKLQQGATSAATVENQSAELERQRVKLEAEQAARKAQEDAQERERQDEYERIKAIKDVELRRQAALEALKRALARRAR